MTDLEFEHAFGRKRGEPGPLSPIARYNVAKMAAKLFVQRRGLDYDLVDFMTSDATIVALSTKTDETRPAAMQVLCDLCGKEDARTVESSVVAKLLKLRFPEAHSLCC